MIIGIEGTSHTLGVGITDGKKILANQRDVYKPQHGKGIHPMEAAKHHEDVKEQVLEAALEEAKIEMKDVSAIAFSCGPGLPPCLKVAAEFSKKLGKENKLKLIPVNHPVAHIEIGRFACKVNDPIIVYVSGGNTQIIGYAAGRYRVFGETLDIAIGNARDMFIRQATGEFPGGPVVDRLANNGKKFIELPYVVKGMDLSYTGILTAALKKLKTEKLEDVAFSFSETTFAMLCEVAERALAHTGKNELMLVGGVAASPHLQRMMKIMCSERGAKFEVVPQQYSGDNGAMICWTGYLSKERIKSEKADFYPRQRVDDVDVTWI